MNAKVVELRPADNPQSIPTQLREMADAFEGGEFEGQKQIIVIIPRAGEMPEVFSWGSGTRGSTFFELNLAAKGMLDPQFEW